MFERQLCYPLPHRKESTELELLEVLTENATEKITMKHLAAYLLLSLGGNTSPSSDDIKGVLSSVGIDADEERLDKLISDLEGKDLQEVRGLNLVAYGPIQDSNNIYS